MHHHLAQVNVGRAVAPIESPIMADFTDNLDLVNAAGEAAPGFVWRLADESGNATAIPFLGDDRLIANLTVWESMADLERFMYDEPHRRFLRRRREWFQPLGRPATACWWIPVGHRPDYAEAERMITRLWDAGPDQTVFALGGGAPPPPPS